MPVALISHCFIAPPMIDPCCCMYLLHCRLLPS